MYTGTIPCPVPGSYKRAIKSTKHRAEPTAISHQPSKAESTEHRHNSQAPSTKHQAHQHRTQAPITHHPSPSTSKQAPITTYAYIPLFVVLGSFLLISFLSFCCYFFWSHCLDKNFKREVTVEVRLGPLAMDSPVL